MRYRNYDNGSNYFYLGILLFFMFGGFRTLFLIVPLILFLIPGILCLVLFFKLIGSISSNSKIYNSIKDQGQSRSHYVELIVHILTGGMKADGHIDSREVQTLITFFQRKLGFNSMQLRWLQDLVQHSINRHFDLSDVCNMFNSEYGLDEKHLCLELLFEVIASDEKITSEERTYIDRVIQLLDISHDYAEQLKKKYYSDSATMTDYEILGVENGSPFETVKKAYRNLSKQYHPDKVQHLGDDFKQFAEQKIKDINKAYDSIKLSVST